MITVIGGANVDVSARALSEVRGGDSCPSSVMVSCGGVARNIAQDLSVMGYEVKLLTAVGDDVFGEMIIQECQHVGIDTTDILRVKKAGSGTYLCFNDSEGEMVAAAADTDVINKITPAWLRKKLRVINSSEAVVADCNLSHEALMFLIDNVRVPLFVDGVSVGKSRRVIEALNHSECKSLYCLKVNKQEALTLTGSECVEDATQSLLTEGIDNVVITLGAEGALLAQGRSVVRKVAKPVSKIVNTTGAGDAFLAAVVSGTLKGLSANKILALALATAKKILTTDRPSLTKKNKKNNIQQ